MMMMILGKINDIVRCVTYLVEDQKKQNVCLINQHESTITAVNQKVHK